MAGGSSSPGNCGLTLAHQRSSSDAASLRPNHRSHGARPAAAISTKLEYRGRRSIMADQPNKLGERMDERSGGSGVGGGSGGGTSGTRNDSGGESRGTSGVSRKTPRGFAAMDPQAQRAIAAKGGRAAHQKGTAHEFTSEEARVAGRKGGEASRGGRRSSTSSSSSG